MQRMALILLILIAGITGAFAQNVTVIGPIVPGDCVIFSSTTIIKDAGTTCNNGGTATPGGSNGQVQFNNTGSFGGLTNAQLTALVQQFTPSLSGAVPASGGGTTTFLRADGTFAAPPIAPNGSLYAQFQSNVSGSSSNTTGTISASSTALTLASAIDFKNSQGIRINHAGPATTAGQVSGQFATPTGTTGSTTYTYAVVAFDANGGYGTSAGNFSTATGNATLTTTNYNAIAWNAATGAVGYAVYGRTSGSMALLAFVSGTAFNDVGSTAFPSETVPDWIPSTPPTLGAAQWLVTSVASGGGTTSLTLGASSTTAASSQGVFHDDTVALQAALTSAISNNQSLNLGNGIYRITSALTGAGPLQIYANGPICCGLVPGTVVLTSPTQDGFALTGNYISIHDMNFEGGSASGSGQVAGSLINFTTGSGAVWINRINSQFAFNGISCSTASTCAPFYVSDNLLTGYGRMINLATGGDSVYYANQLTPISVPGATIAIGMFIAGNPGGTKFIGNKINGCCLYAGGVEAVISQSDGDIMIVGNSIEGYANACIEIDRSGTPTFGNISINSNQCAAGSNAGVRGIYFSSNVGSWLSNAAIIANVISNAGSAAAAIQLGALNQFVVEGNSLSGSSIGIRAEAAATGCMIGVNVFNTVTTQIQDASAACSYASITTTAPSYP